MKQQDSNRIDAQVFELLKQEGPMPADTIRARLGFGDVMPTPIGGSLMRLMREGSILYLGEREGWAVRKKEGA